MKHRLRKLTSVVLAVIMVFSVLTIASFTVSATSFVPRTTAPDTNNAYYYNSAYNPFSRGQCTWYVWGRAFEITGIRPKYSTYPCDGKDVFYNCKSAGYSTGTVPKVGAIACWGASNSTWGYGHVAIVEKIIDGTVYVSEYNRVGSLRFSYNAIPNLPNFIGYVYLGDFSSGNDPKGCVDGVTGGIGTVTVRGWAFDVDDINTLLNIHVYIGGPSGAPNAEGIGWIIANTYRPDVDNVYGCGGYHGYDITIPTTKTGTQSVYVYAINVGGGENVCIGSGTVNITADTEKPSIERTYLSEITSNSYRVCVIPKDKVGIKKVSVATWTQPDQSDLIWHDAINNGYGTYFIDLQRSDYSKTGNSIYQNHAYVYDYAGNSNAVSIAMDYRAKSDTGQTLPDGEYRIVTSVSENKALDVAGGKDNNGTNIQIYSNLNYSNQTFDIQYIGDGFYTIFSHSAGKSIDVEGDTYLPGTNVVISEYHEGANQQWILKPTDDGYYAIVSRSNGLALDLASAKNENGANVQVFTVNNSAAQKWKFRRVINSEMVNVGNVIRGINNTKLNPEIQVIDDNNVLVLNKDYKVEINGDIESGTGTVKVTGIGDYCDIVTKSFEINQCEIGDVNLDGTVNIDDVTLIQKYIANMSEFDSEQLKAADVTGDNDISIDDVTAIQKYLAGMITTFANT